MLKRILLIVCMLTASASFAQVDVNKGDQAALSSIKGIGASTAKRIADERTKGGNFKDWGDFESRVQGIGEKKAVKLSEAGLQVNGKAKGEAAAAPPAKASSKPAAKPK
ncbi:competence protein ComEA [Collimonas sp. PA-H2]|uniref:ComEA family DNA-binding protein n=1 Tax=Collimonas sp. PA-H2 TaxID=1881062 RepID=UPI000BF61BE7|nr:helix-hairpin-helix domain-containing protein [Collimonas sp. PA-H2]PFH08957.1 competence protein ComEA [Collimonas sp. PA-H2]